MTDSSGPIVFACALDGQGGSRPLPDKEVTSVLQANELGWVHLDGTHPDTRNWIENYAPFLNIHVVEALLEKETRPRMVEYDEGLMIILRGVNTNPEADPEDMVSLRIWIDEKQIITTRLRRLQSVQDIKALLESGEGPKDSGEFLARLCAKLFEKMEPVIRELDDQTDDLEEKVIEHADADLRHDITDLRRTAIILRRYIAPQKDVMANLRISEKQWIKPQNKRFLQESYDRLLRYVEDLDAIRERAQIVKDELANALADRMNKNMYVLSIIAAIFLPLGFLTGLLGINVGGIPGADNPDAFTMFGIGLVVLVIAQIVLFKKMKWF